MIKNLPKMSKEMKPLGVAFIRYNIPCSRVTVCFSHFYLNVKASLSLGKLRFVCKIPSTPCPLPSYLTKVGLGVRGSKTILQIICSDPRINWFAVLLKSHWR